MSNTYFTPSTNTEMIEQLEAQYKAALAVFPKPLTDEDFAKLVEGQNVSLLDLSRRDINLALPSWAKVCAPINENRDVLIESPLGISRFHASANEVYPEFTGSDHHLSKHLYHLLNAIRSLKKARQFAKDMNPTQ